MRYKLVCSIYTDVLSLSRSPRGDWRHLGANPGVQAAQILRDHVEMVRKARIRVGTIKSFKDSKMSNGTMLALHKSVRDDWSLVRGVQNHHHFVCFFSVS